MEIKKRRIYAACGVSQTPIYKKDKKEIYFLGSLDGQGRWNGHCLINIYEEGNLISITDGVYLNGVLSEFKQVFKDEMDKKTVWIVTDRVNQGGFDTGVSMNF